MLGRRMHIERQERRQVLETWFVPNFSYIESLNIEKLAHDILFSLQVARSSVWSMAASVEGSRAASAGRMAAAPSAQMPRAPKSRSRTAIAGRTVVESDARTKAAR